MKWNEIPFDESASPEVKALEFDLQFEENGGGQPQADNNPYSPENFNSQPERRNQ
jgi:hypothetical protein